MAYQPPKGVRPPQLEGTRTGRPKGSKNLPPAIRASRRRSRVARDITWAYRYHDNPDALPPSAGAKLFLDMAGTAPDKFADLARKS